MSEKKEMVAGQGSSVSVQFQPDAKTLATMHRLESKAFSDGIKKTTASFSSSHIIK